MTYQFKGRGRANVYHYTGGLYGEWKSISMWSGVDL